MEQNSTWNIKALIMRTYGFPVDAKKKLSERKQERGDSFSVLFVIWKLHLIVTYFEYVYFLVSPLS